MTTLPFPWRFSGVDQHGNMTLSSGANGINIVLGDNGEASIECRKSTTTIPEMFNDRLHITVAGMERP